MNLFLASRAFWCWIVLCSYNFSISHLFLSVVVVVVYYLSIPLCPHILVVLTFLWKQTYLFNFHILKTGLIMTREHKHDCLLLLFSKLKIIGRLGWDCDRESSAGSLVIYLQ